DARAGGEKGTRRQGGDSAAPRRPPPVKVMIEPARWKTRRGVRPLLRRAIAEAAALSTVALSTRPVELAIVLTNDSAIRKLNRTWRGEGEATQMISFPAPHPREPPGVPSHPHPSSWSPR